MRALQAHSCQAPSTPSRATQDHQRQQAAHHPNVWINRYCHTRSRLLFQRWAARVTPPCQPTKYPKLTMGGVAWMGGPSTSQTSSISNGGFDRALGLDGSNGSNWSACKPRPLGWAILRPSCKWTTSWPMTGNGADRQAPGGRHGAHRDRGDPGPGGNKLCISAYLPQLNGISTPEPSITSSFLGTSSRTSQIAPHPPRRRPGHPHRGQSRARLHPLALGD